MPSSTAAPAPSSMQQPPPFTGAPNLASGLLAMVHTEHDNDTTLDPAEGARLLAAAAAAATATSPSLQSLPAPSTARHTPVASSMHSSATTPASPVLASSPDAKPAAPPHRPDSPTSLHTATHPDPDPVPSDTGDATPADLKVAISDVTDERKSEAGSPIEDAEEDGMPDGGAHAWLVVLASFVVQFWVFGVLYSFGVYNTYFMSENLASSSAVSFIGTLGAALLPMLGLFSGRIAERFGFQRMVLIGALIATSGLLLASFSTKLWHLYLTQGVLYGVGASIAYFPAVTIPNQFFSTRRGLATGLASSGSGFGGLALSLATDAMISRIGFAWCLRVTALSMLVCIAAALPALRSRFESPAPHTPTARFPPTPAHATSKPHPQPHAQPPAEPLAAMLTRLVLRDRRFQLLATGAFFATFGNLVPIYFLSAFAVRRLGAPAATGSRLIAAFDGAIGAGRVLLGLGADRAVGRLNALSACMLLSAVSMLVMWTTADSVPALAAFAVVNGVTSGGFISLYPVAVASLYGVAQLPSIYGLVFTIASVGNLAGAPLAGAIQEAAGYNAAIVYAGAVTLVSFAFVWAVRRRVEPKLLRRV